MSDRVKGQGVFYDDVKTCNETVAGSSWQTVNHLKEQQETVEWKSFLHLNFFKKMNNNNFKNIGCDAFKSHDKIK